MVSDTVFLYGVFFAFLLAVLGFAVNVVVTKLSYRKKAKQWPYVNEDPDHIEGQLITDCDGSFLYYP